MPKFSCRSKNLVAPGNRGTANFKPWLVCISFSSMPCQIFCIVQNGPLVPVKASIIYILVINFLKIHTLLLPADAGLSVSISFVVM